MQGVRKTTQKGSLIISFPRVLGFVRSACAGIEVHPATCVGSGVYFLARLLMSQFLLWTSRQLLSRTGLD